MVLITEQLVRKRAEHNEKIISTLEELSLHQENIEKIEHLQNWCKNLEILLLQGNIISRIENLNKLKKLRYLNLALNNIEVIENLEGLESLEKLDLTLNFIGKLTSVVTLKANLNLRQLLRNPCADYKHYRDYTITVVPQLNELDCDEIKRNERILASQKFEDKIAEIKTQEAIYIEKRTLEKSAASQNLSVIEEINDPEELERFWNEPSHNTPEDRIKLAHYLEKSKKSCPTDSKINCEKSQPRRFSKDGRPLNINRARIPFTLSDNGSEIEVDIAVYRYLGTEHIKVDVQPNYVLVIIKDQLFQLALETEVHTELATCQRSTTTGHLVIKLPKIDKSQPTVFLKTAEKTSQKEIKKITYERNSFAKKREYLEIGPTKSNISEILNCTKEDSDVPDLE